ncbi:MAG TPA: hypothetical protein VMM18_10825 [Gemmatimonadaceae bacterium]|nr:hypothetical protein [Gemmatimonadaceae bacterium]
MLRRGRAAVVALVPALIITWACQREVDSRTDTVVDAAEVVLMESASSAHLVDTAGGVAKVEVVIVTENPTDGPIYLASCGPDTPRFVEWLAGDIWDVAMNLDCPPAATPMAIAPRSTRTDTLSVRASLGAGAATAGQPQFAAANVNGTYRIVYDAYRRPWTLSDARPDTATQLPEVERRSGAFELRTR